MNASDFSLGKEGSDDGSFQRQDSAFRETDLVAEPGRYHLYVSYACPWASRIVIGRVLLGLEDALPMSVVDPIRGDAGWRFSGGEYVDHAEGAELLMEHYRATDPSFDGRASVPVLWDVEEKRIVNNESGDILRLLSTALAPLATREADLVPAAHAAAIDALNDRIYDDLNNAVYKAGFTRNQSVYEREVASIFTLLDELEERLAGSRFLFGDEPVETDWRLFTTLIRFDPVYSIHFKCSVRRIAEYPHLSRYLRELYRWPGIAATVRFDEIRAHYYRTHPMINPSGLVAVLPAMDL